MNSTTQRAPNLVSVQALRGCAAMSVVLFHLHILSRGSLGVDIFFAISGFIMGIVGVKESPLAFIYKRIIRICPIYWIMTFIMAIFAISHLLRTVDFSVHKMLLSLFFIPYFSSNGEIWPVLVPGWTLNFEMFFYLVFCGGIALRWPRMFSALVMVLLVVLGLIFPWNNPIWLTITNARVLEFVLGLGISQFAAYLTLPVARIMLCVGIVALVAVLGGAIDPGIQVYHFLIVGVPAAAVVCGAVALEYRGGWPAIPVLSYVGDLSYSLYLTNALSIAVAERLLGQHFRLAQVVGLVLAVVVAAAVYHCIERPTLSIFRKWSPVRSRAMA